MKRIIVIAFIVLLTVSGYAKSGIKVKLSDAAYYPEKEVLTLSFRLENRTGARASFFAPSIKMDYDCQQRPYLATDTQKVVLEPAEVKECCYQFKVKEIFYNHGKVIEINIVENGNERQLTLKKEKVKYTL